MLSMHAEETLVRQALDGRRARLHPEERARPRPGRGGQTGRGRRDGARSRAVAPRATRSRASAARALTPRELEVLQLICDGLLQPRNRRRAVDLSVEHRRRAPRQHHERARRPQDGRARRVRDPARPGDSAVNRREFLRRAAARRGRRRGRGCPRGRRTARPRRRGFRLDDVTGAVRPAVPPQQRRVRRQAAARNARLRLRVPRLRRRRLAGHPARQRHGLARPQAAARSTLRAVPQQPQRHVHRRHAARGPRRRDVRHGRRRRRLQQRRLSRTSSSRASARTGCFATPARARSSTSRAPAASAAGTGFSTSALWFDYDRDGLLDLFVCNYVKWSPEHDVFCSLDGKQKSYCTPEAYRGDTCWLFRNRGNGTFEDVTATSGVFDTSSKSLGVAMLDYDQDGWPDLFVANDTQPNKLYRNLRNGTFKDVARRGRAGVQRGRQGARRHGRGRRRFRQLRPRRAWRSRTSTTR